MRAVSSTNSVPFPSWYLEIGKGIGAKHAEAIFVGGQLPEKVRPLVNVIRELVKDKFGRNPTHIKVIAGMTIIVAETDEAARAKREELLSYGDKEGALALFGGTLVSTFPHMLTTKISGS